MYASGIPFNGDTIKERSLGGSESAAYYVAKELAERGHRVVMFTEHETEGLFDGVHYLHNGPKTQQAPLGTAWHFYCQHTPHDVNIIQRVPHGFATPIQSKINLWWAHDIALHRNNNANMAQTWQVNRYMPVSKWFKEQLSDAWTIPRNMITPIHNGVDYSLFEQFELKDNSKTDAGPMRPDDITMFYSSRPERGLNHLVEPGGIMEQLLEKAPHVQLKVCGYVHDVPEMEGFYGFLRERIDQLPNCEHIGSLTKNDLYEKMCTEFDVWCYPTLFEEVSCITAMEAMAAGLTIFTTNIGALPETIGDYENASIFNAQDGIDIDKFVSAISGFNNKFRRRPRRDYTWQQTTNEIEEIINDEFEKANEEEMHHGCADAVAREYLRNSDIVALDKIIAKWPDRISDEVKEQLPFYDFRNSQEAYAKHYADGTEEMYDGPNFKYEPEGFQWHPRFQEVKKHLVDLPEGSRVIDYGCAHGHFTNFLARELPHLSFTGVDVSPKAIEVAIDKANEWELKNVKFVEDDWLGDGHGKAECDAIILGEILEHVPDPVLFMDTVHAVVGDAKRIITTPFGSWEQMSYEKEGEKRFHLHHFERSDLVDMFGYHEDFAIACLVGGTNLTGEVLGWYVTTYQPVEGNIPAAPIDYERKLHETVPRQTVSFCAIVKDGGLTLPILLDSIQPWVDEIVIGVDEGTTDPTREMLDVYNVKNRAPRLPVKWFEIPSPTEIGFDAARNLALEQCSKQWIMWADADEDLVCGERIPKYLRNNGWDGYGIPQHHFSIEPLGVLSTDFPVRMFRRKDNIRFRGVVHEHPEDVTQPNEGVGHAWVVHELHFAHRGYPTEAVRRKRFERNISLMARDRETYPDRILGKFLWIRDLALMCRFELESNGMQVSPDMRQKALMGLELWEETIDKDGDHPQTVRMIKDHLEFYNTLTNVLDEGFDFKIKLSSGKITEAPQLEQVPELSARFLNKRHLDKFLSIVLDNEVKHYEEKYL
jgi:glycosyltransferase involved in cell wall biosynthesis/SAM-dependent methyltransferase